VELCRTGALSRGDETRRGNPIRWKLRAIRALEAQ
jgi:hypothetical protein